MPTEGTAYLFTAYLKRDAKPEPQGIALSFDGQLPVPSTLNAQVFTLLFSLIIHPFSVFVNSKTRIFPKDENFSEFLFLVRFKKSEHRSSKTQSLIISIDKKMAMLRK